MITETLRYGDYGLRTTVGRKLSCCVVLGRVHNEWRENTKLRSHTTHTGLRTSARCNNTAACLCFCYFVFKMSFVKVQNSLVYLLADEITDEEEFVLLFDAYKSSNPAYPYWEYDAFCLDSFDSSEC